MGQLRFDFDKSVDKEIPFPDVTPINNKPLKEIDMKACAKYCAVAYNKFLAILTEKQILGKSSQGRYTPFQKYLQLGWFIQRGVMVDRKGFRGTVQKVTVTPLGYNEIKKIINGK
jgi:phage antirepressor YoqD-like protein